MSRISLSSGVIRVVNWPDIRDTVSAGAGIIAAVYAILAYHRPRGGASVSEFAPASGLMRARGIIVLLSLIIVGQSYYSLTGRHAGAMPDTIAGWGINAGATQDEFSYSMTVDARQYMEYKDDYHLMLIVRIPYANIDGMSDTAIEKSAIYKIVDGPILLAHVNGKKLKVFVSGSLPIQYDLVLLPDKITPDKINSLGDVEALGGKILATREQTIPVQIHPPATN
jgi:hypothetical protein